MVRIFVYGTLKQGFPNFHFMHNPKNGVAKFVCNAVTVKKYPLVVAGTAKIPFILNQEGIGEVGRAVKLFALYLTVFPCILETSHTSYNLTILFNFFVQINFCRL